MTVCRLTELLWSASVSAFLLAAPTNASERIIAGDAGFAAQYTYELRVSDADGQNEHPLLTGVDAGPAYNASFSSDGQWILFTAERFGSADVYRVHSDGSGLERLTDNTAFDDQGTLSPDGRTLAFVSSREGGIANIWLQDLASRKARPLTRTTAGNFRPSWSPDGQWIAFSSDRDMPRLRYLRDWSTTDWEMMQRTAVYIVHPDGTGLRRITDLDSCAGSPRWSTDGSRLIFMQVADMDALRRHNPQAQVVSIDINTGARSTHSDAKSYAVSPAFVSSDVGYGTFDPRTEQAGKVMYASGLLGPAAAENPVWSPDGKHVAFNRRIARPRTHWTWTEVRATRDPRYEFITGSAFSQETVPFTRGGDHFIYRPFGRALLRLIDWNGVGPTLVDGNATGRRIGRAALTQNGQLAAFSIWTSGKADEIGQLALVDHDGSHLRVVTHHAVRADYPSFSPDGKRLVYQLGKFEDKGNTERGLRILSLADGKVSELTTELDSTPTWSPRGDRIAFTGWKTGDFEIYTVRPDGTDLRQLTSGHGNDAHPVWSPDGKWIAFVSSRMGWKDEALLPGHGPQTYGEIFVMRADGTDVRQLTDNQWEEGTIAWPRTD